MDGKLVDVARRGVQADDQFHDSRRETRDATMAKSPEKPRRAVSLLECPGNLRGANATLDDDGLGVEIGAKLFRDMQTRDHHLSLCVALTSTREFCAYHDHTHGVLAWTHGTQHRESSACPRPFPTVREPEVVQA